MGKITPNGLLILVMFLLFTYGTGVVGTILAGPNNFDLYSELVLPFFAAPSWIYIAVWLVLYGLISIAVYVVWERGSFMVGDDRPEQAIFLYFLTIAFTALWPPLFFALEMFAVSAFVLFVIAFFSFFVLYRFFQVSNWSGFLFLPFTCWSVYATILNASIAFLNQ